MKIMLGKIRRRMQEVYITQVSEEIEGRITTKTVPEFQ